MNIEASIRKSMSLMPERDRIEFRKTAQKCFEIEQKALSDGDYNFAIYQQAEIYCKIIDEVGMRPF